MTKKNKIILGLTIVVVIIGVIAFWPRKESVKTIVDEKIMIPTQSPVVNTSNTGAKEISLSEIQYSEVYLIKDLRNKVPINRTYFVIDFDYGVNKFIVKYKDIEKGKVEFNKWLTDTGYKAISEQYFQTE
jgi:hypothetical protein